MKRHTLSYITIILACMLLAGCQSHEVQQEPLRIGVDVFPGWAHVFIAQEKGFFEKNGVQVEIVLHEDYLTIQDQFLTGDLDGAFMVYADAIYSSDRGSNAKVVYISDHSITGDVIAAKPEFTSLLDLRGKKISVEGINSFSHLFLLAVLEKHGLGEGDIFIENIGAQDVVRALSEGEIVAGHTYGPGKIQAEEKGYVNLAFAGDVKGIITDILAFHDDSIKERPDEVKAIVKSLFEAKEFQKTNREEALRIISSAIGETPESIGIGIDAVEYLNLQENALAMEVAGADVHSYDRLQESTELISEFFLSRGQISRGVSVDAVVDSRFVNQLLEETE